MRARHTFRIERSLFNSLNLFSRFGCQGRLLWMNTPLSDCGSLMSCSLWEVGDLLGYKRRNFTKPFGSPPLAPESLI